MGLFDIQETDFRSTFLQKLYRIRQKQLYPDPQPRVNALQIHMLKGNKQIKDYNIDT